MHEYEITDKEFDLFREFIYEASGINLGPEKKTLVTSRLGKRLRHYSLTTFAEYFDVVTSAKKSDEKQMAIDLLTTNETYFFREPKHFGFLEKEVVAKWQAGRTFRVWSAASSTGEEAYSIAMLLDDTLGARDWEIFGSDISSRVLAAARKGHYLQNRIDGIPREYLQKYCLKGVGEHEGTLLIDSKLRKRVSFDYMNLKNPLEVVGFFDVIFLRNVLIYFDAPTKKLIVSQLFDKLYKGGYLMIGHSESLNGINSDLVSVIPTVYQKP